MFLFAVLEVAEDDWVAEVVVLRLVCVVEVAGEGLLIGAGLFCGLLFLSSLVAGEGVVENVFLEDWCDEGVCLCAAHAFLLLVTAETRSLLLRVAC